MNRHFGQWLYKRAIKNRGDHQGTLTYSYLNEGIKPEGMSQAEIEEVMRVQEVSFPPQIYREYLETMAKRSFLFPGEDTTYDILLTAKADCMEGFTDQGPTAHDFRHTFVFLSHQYRTFFLFYTDDRSENPEVYYYQDDGELHDGRGGFGKLNTLLRDLFLYEVRPIGWRGPYEPAEDEAL